MTSSQKPRLLGPLTMRWWITLIGFLIVAMYFLWTEHEAHVKAAIPYLPYLLIAACLLLHLFMHRGHGNHRSQRDEDDSVRNVRGEDT